MTKEDALDLQATVNGILAQAMGERSQIGGPVNWGDLRCVDVEISLLDGHVTVTVEEASPSAPRSRRGEDTTRSRSERNGDGLRRRRTAPRKSCTSRVLVLRCG